MGQSALSRVEEDVREEIARQDAKWGPMNYPDGTGRPGDEEAAAAAKAACKANGPAEDNWRDILHEEVREAFAESDSGRLRKELVQVAAVVAQWILAIDGRTAPPEEVGDIPVEITRWSLDNNHQFWETHLTERQLADLEAFLEGLPGPTGTDDFTVYYPAPDDECIEYGLTQAGGEEVLRHLGLPEHGMTAS